MTNSLALITRKWAPSALEYAKFLNRYKIKTVCIITEKSRYGYIMNVYADEEEYLDYSFNNENFDKEEKQICELLNTIEALSMALFEDDYEDEYEEDEEFEYDDEYDDEIEPKSDNYFD